MNKKYKLWNYKYDFAEINFKNWKEVFRDTFRLNTRKVALLSMLFTLEILMTIISKVVMGIAIPMIAGVYTIEISFFIILVIYLCSNYIYASILSIGAIWFRLLLGSEPIGLLSMMISDMTFLTLFAIIFFILKKLILLKTEFKNQIKIFIFLVCLAGLVSMVGSGFISMICNDKFIFNMYYLSNDGSGYWEMLLWVGFGVTLAKYIINIILFISTIKILFILIKQSRA
ncbi:ECF transporter S component [Mesoplasma tabanidae]|nr:ECF transporter S component [Mesoplasma tabanidae]